MMKEAEAKNDVPLKPQGIVKAFGDRMPHNAILASDSGQNTELAARHIDMKAEQAFAVSGSLASMACGLPYAIAQQASHSRADRSSRSSATADWRCSSANSPRRFATGFR